MSASQYTTPPADLPEGLPTAAIVCIAIGAYIVLIVVLLMVRECMMRRNMWHSMACCGTEGEIYCCECWISCCESCNCCQSPNITSCLDSICPQRRHYDFGDVLSCQCCAECCQSCCGENGCDCCNSCNCNCSPPECDTINCCCFEIQMKQPVMGQASLHNDEVGYPPQGTFNAEGNNARRGGYPTSSSRGGMTNNAFLASGAVPSNQGRYP